MITFSPRLYDRPGIEGERRRTVVRIMQAALAAVDPAEAVRRFVQRKGDLLTVGEREYDLAAFEHIYVVGAGKADAAMAQALTVPRPPLPVQRRTWRDVARETLTHLEKLP